MSVRRLANDTLLIVQDMTPKLSGHLAFNSTKIRHLTNGYKIISYNFIAPYNVFQQGPKGPTKNHGYWDKARDAVGAYIAGELAGNKNNMNTTRKSVSKVSADNPLRQQTLINSLHQSIRRV